MKTFHSPLSPPPPLLLGCASEPDSQDLDDFCPSSFQSVRLDGKEGNEGRRGEGGGGIGADINYSRVVQRGKYRLDALTFNEVASCVRRKEGGRGGDGVN